MALPFLSRRAASRDHVIAVDLGGRTTKAVDVQRKNDGFLLHRFALLDAPIYEKGLSAELLAEHLKTVAQALEARTRTVSLAIGVADSVVRHAELPTMSLEDMRQVLKNNTKQYLQQELPGHVFDCCPVVEKAAAKAADKAKAGVLPKQRVLAAGARQQLVEDLQTAVRATGLVAEHIMPGLLGPLNAFERALPEVFQREAVALVDIGFRHTSICLLLEGQLMLSRVLPLGGDKFTTGLAETLGISYAEAEGIKLGMPGEVQDQLRAFVVPLGRELRASMDFFEHEYDRPVTQAFVSGGSARSDFILQTLHGELGVECRTWNPTGFMQHSLPPQQVVELEPISPQLTVAVGAALAVL